jgi:hypothetical protein
LKLLAAAFGMSKSMGESEKLWQWIRMIAGLKQIKIIWPEEQYNNPRSQIFIISVDGTDFRVWEKKHPFFPYDKGEYSHKYNHGGLKYEIAIDIFTRRVMWISGPHRGGLHGKSIFVEMGLRAKILLGKKAVTDRVYGT